MKRAPQKTEAGLSGLAQSTFAEELKFHFLKFITILTFAGSCDAGLVGFLTQQRVDWKFIEAVGGLEVSLIDRKLVVSCDVSGLKKITTKPTLINSGIGVRKLKCSRSGNVIRLSIVTSVSEEGMKTDCRSIDLSAYASGSYSVVYLNPDKTTQPLGKISLP